MGLCHYGKTLSHTKNKRKRNLKSRIQSSKSWLVSVYYVWEINGAFIYMCVCTQYMYMLSHQQRTFVIKVNKFQSHGVMVIGVIIIFYMLINFVYCLLFFACSCLYRRPKLFGASHFGAGFGRNFIRMHVPSQNETPLWVARTAMRDLRGLLCPSPMLFLRSLPRTPRAQKTSYGSSRR